MLVYISEVTLCQANGMGAILGIKSATHANSAWPSLGGRQMKDWHIHMASKIFTIYQKTFHAGNQRPFKLH